MAKTVMRRLSEAVEIGLSVYIITSCVEFYNDFFSDKTAQEATIETEQGNRENAIYNLDVVPIGLASGLRSPLTTVPDDNTQLDESLAAKARKLAGYVITKGKQKGILSYNPEHTGGSADYQGVQAVMVIDGWRYTVWVANEDEGKRAYPTRDMSSIWMRPNGSHGQDNIVTFSDVGLDGRCDSGVIGKRMSGTGKVIFYNDKADLRSGGLEHREMFQRRYEEALDKLVGFYERR